MFHLSLMIMAILISGPQQSPGPSIKTSDDKLVVIRVDAKGTDIKVTCMPENDRYTITQIGDVIRIVFDPPADGSYVFAIAVSSEGKAAVTQHLVKATGVKVVAAADPKPKIDVPEFKPNSGLKIVEPDKGAFGAKKQDVNLFGSSELAKQIQNLYLSEPAVSRSQARDALVKMFEDGKKLIATNTKSDELLKAQRKLTDTVRGMDKIKDAVYEEIIWVIGATGDLNRESANQVWDRVIVAIKELK